MADIEVTAVNLTGGRVQTLQIQFKRSAARTIDRATALGYLREGHSLIPVSGHGYHVTRGGAIERVEVDGEEYLRTDTRVVAADEVHLPHAH